LLENSVPNSPPGPCEAPRGEAEGLFSADIVGEHDEPGGEALRSLQAASHGVEHLGEAGSEALPFPQESTPLPLHDSFAPESWQMQGEALTGCLARAREGVRRRIHHLNNLLAKGGRTR